MRKRLSESEKAKSAPVSLSPKDKKFVNDRCKEADISFSRFFQVLLAYDRMHDILPAALVMGLKKKDAK